MSIFRDYKKAIFINNGEVSELNSVLLKKVEHCDHFYYEVCFTDSERGIPLRSDMCSVDVDGDTIKIYRGKNHEMEKDINSKDGISILGLWCQDTSKEKISAKIAFVVGKAVSQCLERRRYWNGGKWTDVPSHRIPLEFENMVFRIKR